MGGKLVVSAQISNAVAREADETVQLYTRQLAASVTRPVRELRAFRRVHLKPGEKQTVEFTLAASDLAFYDAGGHLGRRTRQIQRVDRAGFGLGSDGHIRSGALTANPRKGPCNPAETRATDKGEQKRLSIIE